MQFARSPSTPSGRNETFTFIGDHRVDAILHHPRHGRPLGERLGVETGHRDRADLEAGVAGGVEKLLANGRIGELVVERVALAEAAHVDLDAVGADVLGPLERAELLPLENHPIADADLVAKVGRTLRPPQRRFGARASEQAGARQRGRPCKKRRRSTFESRDVFIAVFPPC